MANWRRRCSYLLARRRERRRHLPPAALLVVLSAAACGNAREPSADRPETPDPSSCVAAEDGRLQARLRGEIEVEISWGSDVAQCRGGVRPQGDGVRLLYRGATATTGPLLIVFGLAPLRPGESARNVPANLTLVREGSGQFYATQGQDKCAFDEVRQSPVPGAVHLYRLEGRGYCTQPARALAGDGAVLVSRFDVVAIVEDSIAAASPEVTSAGTAR